MRRMILPLMLVVFAGCQPTGTLSDEDLTEIRALARSLDDAALAEDFSALTALFTEDCLVLVPNTESVEGREAFLAMVEAAGYDDISAHSIEVQDVYGYGDVGYMLATYDETYTMHGVAEPIHDTGRILTIVRKQPNGSWRFSVWTWASDMPLPSMEGEHAEGSERAEHT